MGNLRLDLSILMHRHTESVATFTRRRVQHSGRDLFVQDVTATTHARYLYTLNIMFFFFLKPCVAVGLRILVAYPDFD